MRPNVWVGCIIWVVGGLIAGQLGCQGVPAPKSTDNTPSNLNIPKACLQTCQGDADCAPCGDKRSKCIEGVCASEERAGPHERCGAHVGRVCLQGTHCIGEGEQRYCLPACDLNDRRCPGDQASCHDPNGHGQGVCIPDGKAQEGEPCHRQFQGQGRLSLGTLCGKDLHCVEGQCVRPKAVPAYQRCGNGFICDSRSTCVVLSHHSKESYCLPICDPHFRDCQGETGTCIKLARGQGACLPKGTAKEDQPCGHQKETLTAAHICAPGNQCTALSAGGSLCLRKVPLCMENICGEGRHCVETDEGGICLIACQSNNTCAQGLTCQHSTTAGYSGNICVP